MSDRWLLAGLLSAGALHAQSVPPRTDTSRSVASPRDSFPALRARYSAELATVIPRWRVAERAAVLADSLRASRLPPDTVRAGAFTWLTDRTLGSAVPEAVTRSWSELASFFGDNSSALREHLFVARFRKQGGRDSTKQVIDLAEVFPGRLDIFDRVNDDETVEAIASHVLRKGSKIILEQGDSSIRRWLITPFTPESFGKGIRERMFADLVTAPSQVSSRCLGGDLGRCRDALGLTPTADPLTEWYDPPERRLLVLRMRELLDVGPQHGAYEQCDRRRSYGVCDAILRAIPRYVVPPALPVSSRHHLFRIAVLAGGSGAYTRLVAGPPRSMSDRIADAARMPIDSVVARWRNDVLAARPASPALSLLSAWTIVGWGIGIMLLALRFASWR